MSPNAKAAHGRTFPSGAMAQVNGTARETPQKAQQFWTIMDVLKRKLTAWATRSATVGIPSGRVRPSSFVMSTRRTGGGK